MAKLQEGFTAPGIDTWVVQILDSLGNASTLISANASGVTVPKLFVPTGAAGISGTATLVGGTVTVNTTAVTANSLIQICRNTPGGTVGDLRLGAIVAGTSFVINSAAGTDTSTVNWLIIN